MLSLFRFVNPIPTACAKFQLVGLDVVRTSCLHSWTYYLPGSGAYANSSVSYRIRPPIFAKMRVALNFL